MYYWWYYVWVREKYFLNKFINEINKIIFSSGNVAEFNSYELLKNLEQHVS